MPKKPSQLSNIDISKVNKGILDVVDGNTFDLNKLFISKVLDSNPNSTVYLYDFFDENTGSSQKTVVKKQMITEKEAQMIKTEKELLSDCNNPNIIRYKGTSIFDHHIYLQMEYMELGSVDSMLKKSIEVDEDLISYIAYETLRGLVYLHDTKKIFHRDLKPGNILINKEAEVKISDFGISKIFNATIDKHSTFKGTECYTSPERLKEEDHGVKSDIWSFGLTIWTIATGSNPYYDVSVKTGRFNMLKMISEGQIPPFPDYFSDKFKDFLSKTLQKNQKKRSKASELLKHSFVKRMKKEVERYPVKKRIYRLAKKYHFQE